MTRNSTTNPRTLYDILEVEPDAPPQKIQAIYRLRSRAAFPRRPGHGNTELQRQLNEAYAILKDPDARHEYNLRMGLPQPRAIRPGKTIYSEITVPQGEQTVPHTFMRWEPCRRCWGEGCARCGEKGRIQDVITLTVHIPPGVSEILIEGEGAVTEPGSPRGDLVLYVVLTRPVLK